MRSFMLAMGACLAALNFAGCAGTGSCGCGLAGNGALPASTCQSGSCGGGQAADSGCGCGDASPLQSANFGGRSGLGLGLNEAGPLCKSEGGGCQDASCGCNGGNRPVGGLLNRLGRRPGKGCGLLGCAAVGGAGDCGCGSEVAATVESAPAPTPASTAEASSCGCEESAPVEVAAAESVCEGGCDASFGDESIEVSSEQAYETVEKVQTASHDGPGGILGKLGFGKKRASRIPAAQGLGHGLAARHADGTGLGSRHGHGHALGARHGHGIGSRHGAGCGVHGCGGPGGLCRNCLARLGASAGAGSIPHRQPLPNPGAAGQVPTYVYPYYTTRAPRDFLTPNPPTIGY